MGRPKLAEQEIQERLKPLTGWTIKDGKLAKDFEFKNFIEAFGFMTQMALVSEKLNHHPEWQNVYNRLSVQLTTHAVRGITELDFLWVKAAEEV